MTFEKKLAKHLKIAVKTFWRHGNNGVKVRVPVGGLEREDGTFKLLLQTYRRLRC